MGYERGRICCRSGASPPPTGGGIVPLMDGAVALAAPILLNFSEELEAEDAARL